MKGVLEMFDLTIAFLTDLINIIPSLIAILCVFNIISDLLWGAK